MGLHGVNQRVANTMLALDQAIGVASWTSWVVNLLIVEKVAAPKPSGSAQRFRPGLPGSILHERQFAGI